MDRAEDLFLDGDLHWHPFFDSAYSGGGFTLGAGYRGFVSSYNTVDLRGSITFSGYKRRREPSSSRRACSIAAARLSVIGGWREATQVGFYGIGTAQTSKDDRVNYSFTQPYVSAQLEVWPTRRRLRSSAAGSSTRSGTRSGSGRQPSVEEVYTPATLPGLGASPPTCTRRDRPALDWRTVARLRAARRLLRRDGARLRRPRRRLRLPPGRLRSHPAHPDPARRLGAVAAWPRRDDLRRRRRAGALLHAAGARRRLDRCAASRAGASAIDTACCCRPSGACWSTASSTSRSSTTPARSTARTQRPRPRRPEEATTASGFRLHGPLATPLRIELAKSNEGLVIVFSSKAAF